MKRITTIFLIFNIFSSLTSVNANAVVSISPSIAIVDNGTGGGVDIEVDRHGPCWYRSASC